MAGMKKFNGDLSNDESTWVMVEIADALAEDVSRSSSASAALGRVMEHEVESDKTDGDEDKIECEEEDEAVILKVEFFEPAEYWVEAFPLGNGRLGAMVFGGVTSDFLQLNDDTLWSGGPKDWNNAHAREVLPRVRDLVSKGHYSQATNLSLEMLGPDCQDFVPLCDISLNFGEAHGSFDAESYHRELDLERATASVRYTLGDVTYTREYFISQPDQVLVMKISASERKSISVAVTLTSQLHNTSQVLRSDQILVRGNAPGDITRTSVNGEGMAFAALLEVRAGDGTEEAVDDQTLLVKDADWVMILLTSASGFEGPLNYPNKTEKEPSEGCLAAMKRVREATYEKLLENHLKDYQPLFQRVSLSLAKPEKEYQKESMKRESFSYADAIRLESSVEAETVPPAAANQKTVARGVRLCESKGSKCKISTMERVATFKENHDPRMVTLLFQFGRYLLLATSRPGTFVSNLQGIWNNSLNSPWHCVPHININLPMNYWPAEVCNLAECHAPVFDLLATMAITGQSTAQANYGLEGWVGHHNVDIWGQTAPVDQDPVWALWPMGGAWLSLHLWEHYSFSLDKEFLRERAYPILRGCAQFLLAWLVEDDEGQLITNPSTSPEHYFVSPDTGEGASVAYASALDMAIIREVFNSVIESSRILGNLDEDFTAKLTSALCRLYPVKTTSDGCLMEWGEEFEDNDQQHRHMSHLFGLFPGHTLSLLKTPELCEAATRSIIKRGESGPGWSMAWKNALWARLWSSEHAYSMAVRMFTLIGSTQTEESLTGGGLYGNLLNAHPPFQIDGNFGFTAAIAEMLLQSDATTIYLLPALPENAWPEGKVIGLRGRGGVTVSITWSKGILVHATLQFQFPRAHWQDKGEHADEGRPSSPRAETSVYYKDSTVKVCGISFPLSTHHYAYDATLNRLVTC